MSVVTVERGAALSISTTPLEVRISPASGAFTLPTMGSVPLSVIPERSSRWTRPSPAPGAFTLPSTGTMPLSATPAGSSRWMVTRSAKKPLTTMPPGRGSGAFSCTGGGSSSSSSSSSSGWGVGVEV